MVLAIGALIRQTSTTTGTGTYNLDAAIPDKYRGLVAIIGDGNTCHCRVEDDASNDFEWGVYTVTDAAPDTLTRTSIIESSNGNAAVNWGAGTRTIDVIWPPDAAEMRSVLNVETQTKSGTYTTVIGDDGSVILADATGAAFTITLLAPETAGDGATITVKKTDSGANAVTIAGTGAELSFELSAQYQVAMLISDGTNWHLIYPAGVLRTE